MSPPVLVSVIGGLRTLLNEMAGSLGPRLSPALETFRRDVELALERPESLEIAQNQLDFIEELAGVAWDEPLLDCAGPAGGMPPGGRHRACCCPALESREQLERVSELLCHDAEAWLRRRASGNRQDRSRHRHSPT